MCSYYRFVFNSVRAALKRLPVTHLCELHLKNVAVFDARVKVRDLLRGGLDLDDDHDVGEYDNAGGENETEEQDC